MKVSFLKFIEDIYLLFYTDEFSPIKYFNGGKSFAVSEILQQLLRMFEILQINWGEI